MFIYAEGIEKERYKDRGMKILIIGALIKNFPELHSSKKKF